MKKKKNIDIDPEMDLDLPLEEEPAEKPFSFNDLDLGLDFDLSFLDDIEEPAAPVKQAAPEAPAAAEEKLPAPADEPQKAEPSKPVKKAAPAPKAPQKPAAQGQRPVRPADGARKPMPNPDGTAPRKPQSPADGAKKAAPNGQRPAQAKAAPQGQKTPNAPVKNPNAPAKATAPQQKAPETKKKKKGPRVGGVIFYTLYFMFIFAFFLATYLGLNWLKSWLTDYEMAQPTVKAQQVFDQVFKDPDWGALYVSAGAQDSVYEGKEEYVLYMEDKVGDTQLTYMETSAGLSGGKKYLVYLEDEKVASFTLVDQNKTSGSISLDNLENITDIPNWQLGRVEVFFERVGDYRIVTMDGCTAYVNDVALDESFTIQKATTKAVDYLPEGTTGFTLCTQEVTGLMEIPTVTVLDKDGNSLNVTYDEASRTFTARTEANTIIQDQQDVALKAAHTYCLWMMEEEKDRGNLAKYFDPKSELYNIIINLGRLWVQDFSKYEFVDESVTEFTAYTEDIFSVKVRTNLQVTRMDGSTKDHIYDQSMFFHKVSGTWKCFESVNVDITEPVGLVRLTFMNGQDQLHSDFFDTSRREIITPVVSVPEGQVFSGWVTITENEEGATVYNLEFQPDPTTGKVMLPDDATLKPMTLYAYFEDASAVSTETVEATDAP